MRMPGARKPAPLSGRPAAGRSAGPPAGRCAPLFCILLLLAAAAAYAGDWPQAQCTPQRTGWSGDEVKPPYRLRWAWFGNAVATRREEFPKARAEGFAGSVQPVVAGGILYIGSVSGNVYAIEAKTGKTVWKQALKLPVMHTAAVSQGILLVPGMDCAVHAFDAVTGKPLWELPAGAGFSTGILVAGDLAFAACRNGTLYAFEPRSGAVRWKRDLGAPILNTPAASDSMLFVATEEMAAYGLRLADGGILWRAPLQGQSARHYWPVVVKDVVFFRTMSAFPSDRAFGECEEILKAHAGGWPDEREALLASLKEDPSRQSLFAFDAATGKPRFLPPMGLVTPNNDTPRPPAVSLEGKAYLTWRARAGRWQGGTFGTRYTPQIDPIDLQSGDRVVEPFPVVTSQAIELDNDFLFSGGGRILFAKNSFRGTFCMDTTSGAVAGVLRSFADGYPLAPNPVVLYGKTGSGVPGPGGGMGESPVVVADGALFLNAGPLLCLEHAPSGQEARRTTRRVIPCRPAADRSSSGNVRRPPGSPPSRRQAAGQVTITPAGAPAFTPGVSEVSLGAVEKGPDWHCAANEGSLCFAVGIKGKWPEIVLAPTHGDYHEWPWWSFGQVRVPGAEEPQGDLQPGPPTYVTRPYSQKLPGGKSLSVTVSRVSPALLLETDADALLLFARRRGCIVSHVAYATREGVRVAELDEQGKPVGLGEMSEPWLLLWFGERSPFTPNRHWYGNPRRTLDLDIWKDVTEKADRPWLLVLQHKPAECAAARNGFQVRFPGPAGASSLLPLTGARWLTLKATAAWSSALPDAVAQRARDLAAMALAPPIGVREEFSVDEKLDRVILRSTFTFRRLENDWGVEPQPFAPVPPLLAVAIWHGFPVVARRDGHRVALEDLNLPTLLGPYVGIRGAERYDLVFDGLLRYLKRPAPRPAPRSRAAKTARLRLAQEIARMCAAGPLRPLRSVSGEMAVRYYWTNPAEADWALAEALPHLPAELRRRATQYLQEEMRACPPAQFGRGDGARGSPREYYPVPASAEKPPEPAGNPPLGNLYPICLAAENTGDWSGVKAGWEQIRAVFERFERAGDWALAGPVTVTDADPQTDELNARLAGLVGYARMARKLGREGEVRRAEGLFVKVLAERFAADYFTRYVYAAGLVDDPVKEWDALPPAPASSSPALFYDTRRISCFDKFGVMIHSFSQEDSRGWRPCMFPFLNLSPEVAAFLSDHLKESTRAYLQACDAWWTGWFMAEAPQQYGGENCFNPPGIAGPGFQALARVVGDSPDDLLLRLDVPQAKVGDLEYIRKLVAILEARPPAKKKPAPAKKEAAPKEREDKVTRPS